MIRLTPNTLRGVCDGWRSSDTKLVNLSFNWCSEEPNEKNRGTARQVRYATKTTIMLILQKFAFAVIRGC